MTDDNGLDGRIHAALEALIDRAPPPPEHGALTGARHMQGRNRLTWAAAVLLVIVAAGIALPQLIGDEPDEVTITDRPTDDVSTSTSSTVNSSRRLADEALGVTLDAPAGWHLELGEPSGEAAASRFVGPTGEEIHVDWGDTFVEGSTPANDIRSVSLPAGPAEVRDVEGGLQVRIDVSCTWPPCRSLDLYAYGFSEATVGATPEAEAAVVSVLNGLTVVGPSISGTLADGRPWSVSHDLERGLCVIIDDTNLGCDDSGPVVPRTADPSTPRIAIADGGTRLGDLVYGFHPSPPLRPSGARLISVQNADGHSGEHVAVIDPRTGLWALPITPGNDLGTVAYLDESGAVLSTIEFGLG